MSGRRGLVRGREVSHHPLLLQRAGASGRAAAWFGRSGVLLFVVLFVVLFLRLFAGVLCAAAVGVAGRVGFGSALLLVG